MKNVWTANEAFTLFCLFYDDNGIGRTLKRAESISLCGVKVT